MEQYKNIEGKYTTITKGFDWGPAIKKIVLDLGVEIDESSLATDTFNVKAVRRFRKFDFTTFTMAKKEEDYEEVREVTDIYLSDSQGNKSLNGGFVTIEMDIGPTLVEASPFNYNIVSRRNEYVEIAYKISLKEGKTLLSLGGETITMSETGKGNKVGDIKLISDDFDHNQPFFYSDIDLKYATYVPKNASEEESSNPLIIWLHGEGEGGKDTSITVLGNKVVSLATEEIQKFFGKHGVHILAPQSPTMWMDYDGTTTYNNTIEGSDGRSYYTEALMALIKNYVESNPKIDKNRIYIGGCSNGGYMTVQMLINYPEYFAAAYPVCEAYHVDWLTDDRIKAIKDIPMWITHSMSDGVVAVVKGTADEQMNYELTLDDKGEPIKLDNYSNALYNRLQKAGTTNVHYSLFDKVEDTTGNYFMEDGVTPYEYMGHWSWIHTLNNECVKNIDGVDVTIFEWLGKQSKNNLF